MEDRYYTPKEVSERLQVSEKTVRAWITQGGLRAVRAGHFWRIPESALEEFLRATAEQGSSKPDDEEE